MQIAAHASDFVLAGSETTATTLATVTYYLQKHRKAYARLCDEIRATFKSYNDINSVSTNDLPYLQMVILEALRLYPPVPFNLPREAPQCGDIVDGAFVHGGVSAQSSM